MKSLKPLFALLLLTFVTSCGVIPVNLNFESAQMLKEGEFELQASASYYQGDTDRKDDFVARDQYNVGGRLGIGINEKYNLKVKVETLQPTSLGINYDVFELTEYAFQHDVFVEIDNKIGLSEYAAVSIPIGYYANNGVLQFDPRFYITPIRTQKFDLTITPKCHIMSDFWWEKTKAYPGISLGAGFSSDLNVWSIRTEVGYDKFSLSGGFAVSYIFGN